MTLQSKALKAVAICVLVAFMTVTLRVDLLMAATRTKVQSPAQHKVTSAARFQTLLKDTEKLLEGMEVGLERKRDVSAKLKELKRNRSDLQDLAGTIRAEFTKTREELIAKELPPEIIQRHDAFVQRFEDNFKTLLMDLDEIEKPREGGLRGILKGLAGVEKAEVNKKRVEAAREHLEKNIYRKKHIPLDPNKLPHRQSDLKPRKPITDPKEFKKLFPKNQQSSLSGSGSTVLSSMLGIGTAYAQEDPVDPDLAETIEVQFTQEIQDLAASLDHDPVKIYEWVRNNIEFVPTYGSIQGAHMTLLTKQGNAFDISSLLITLLRVSNIKARYVYGTIEVPIDEVMNWVGGFTDAKSAADFIASGGIPITSVIAGGKITKVWMEHVWVEAFVDYIPSRGAVHNEGDTWIPMDGSFKQYNFVSGIDGDTAVPIDVDALLAEVKNQTTLNEEIPSITGLPIDIINNQVTDLHSRLDEYLTANFPDVGTYYEVSDTLHGYRGVVKKELGLSPNTLATMRVITKLNTFSELPDTMRHKIYFVLSTQDYLEDISIQYTISLPEIAGRRVTLSYIPATPDDAQLMADAEDILDFPLYLVSVIPELKIEGQTVASGMAIGMGKEQCFQIAFSNPHGATDKVTNTIQAGEYYAVGLNVNKVTFPYLYERVDSWQPTTAENRDDRLGELLYLTSMYYFARSDHFVNEMTRTSALVSLRQPSESMVGMQFYANYLFDMPMKVASVGLNIDVDRDVLTTFSKSNNKDTVSWFMVQKGLYSSGLEHYVFEYLMEFDAISAVRSLDLASNQNIPIYILDSENIQRVDELQIPSYDKQSIMDFINAGKMVFVPHSTIQYFDYGGIGYIALDPVTGAGDYRISGGLSGGATVRDNVEVQLKMGKALLGSDMREQYLIFENRIKELLEKHPEIADSVDEEFTERTLTIFSLWMIVRRCPWKGAKIAVGATLLYNLQIYVLFLVT